MTNQPSTPLAPGTKRPEDAAMNAGGVMVLVGGAILLLNAMGRELLILSWLGSWQVPVGWSLIGVGLVIVVIRRLQGVPFAALMSSTAPLRAKKGIAAGAAGSAPPAAAEADASPKSSID